MSPLLSRARSRSSTFCDWQRRGKGGKGGGGKATAPHASGNALEEGRGSLRTRAAAFLPRGKGGVWSGAACGVHGQKNSGLGGTLRNSWPSTSPPGGRQASGENPSPDEVRRRSTSSFASTCCRQDALASSSLPRTSSLEPYKSSRRASRSGENIFSPASSADGDGEGSPAFRIDVPPSLERQWIDR